jgi:hypothetical protein
VVVLVGVVDLDRGRGGNFLLLEAILVLTAGILVITNYLCTEYYFFFQFFNDTF